MMVAGGSILAATRALAETRGCADIAAATDLKRADPFSGGHPAPGKQVQPLGFLDRYLTDQFWLGFAGAALHHPSGVHRRRAERAKCRGQQRQAIEAGGENAGS